MLTLDRRTLFRVLELIAVLLLAEWCVPLIKAAASLAHIDLPVMPMLRLTYLFFGFIMLLFALLRLRGEKFSEFGLVVPTRWLLLIGRGLIIFIVVMVFDAVIRPILDPVVAELTGTSRTLAEQHFAALKGNLGLLLYILPFGWIFGGIGEELFYRGYVMTRIAQILGESRWAWIAAVFLQAIPFALGHGYQGPVGMVAIYLGALIVGAGTLIWGRNLWPAMIAHGLQDTLGFIALYYGVASG